MTSKLLDEPSTPSFSSSSTINFYNKCSRLLEKSSGADKLYRLSVYSLRIVIWYLKKINTSNDHFLSLEKSNKTVGAGLQLINMIKQWILFMKPMPISGRKSIYYYSSLEINPHISHIKSNINDLKTTSKDFFTQRIDLITQLELIVSSLSQTRYILRLFGLFSSIPDTYASSKFLIQYFQKNEISFVTKCKNFWIPFLVHLQSWTLTLYYPLDHLYLFWNIGALKGILSDLMANEVSKWSCRCWTMYILIDFLLLAKDVLDYRKTIRSSSEEAEFIFYDGTSDPNLYGTHANNGNFKWIKKSFPNFSSFTENPIFRKTIFRFLINVGDLPLALNWSFDKHFQLSPLTVGLCGSLSTLAGLRRLWDDL